MLAIRGSLAAARSALLQHLRVAVASQRSPLRLNILVGNGVRGFAQESAQNTYLDKSAVTDRVVSVVKRMQQVDPAKVSPSSRFQNDLGLDSLDVVETMMALEDEFSIEIPDAEADKILSCADAIEYIASQPRAK